MTMMKCREYEQYFGFEKKNKKNSRPEERIVKGKPAKLKVYIKNIILILGLLIQITQEY